jgi:hypothetical protein
MIAGLPSVTTTQQSQDKFQTYLISVRISVCNPIKYIYCIQNPTALLTSTQDLA